MIDWIHDVPECGHEWVAEELPEPTECPECGGVEEIKKKIPGAVNGLPKIRP